MPDHYGFVVDSHLDEIERDCQALAAGKPLVAKSKVSAKQASAVIRSQSSSGGWLEQGFVRDQHGKKVTPKEGVVSSATMIANMELLSLYLEQN